VERLQVALREFAQRGAGRGRDGVEDAQQRIALAVRLLGAEAVAGNEFGVVEIVAGVHANARWQPAAHRNFLVLVEQGDLDAVHLVGVRSDHGQRRVHGLVGVVVAPVALERGVEHVAQPVQHHGLLGLAQDAVVHALVVGRASGHAGQGAAGHHDQPAAEFLDGGHLLFVAGDDLIDRLHVLQDEVVGAAARGHQRARHVPGSVQRSADEFQRGRPVQAHAALCGVHGLGHAQAERPEPLAVGDGGVPVHRALQPGVDGGERVGHHVGGGVGDAVELHARRGLDRGGAAQGVGLDLARSRGEFERKGHGNAPERNAREGQIKRHRGTGCAGPQVSFP
jgi:hypothetical protein